MRPFTLVTHSPETTKRSRVVVSRQSLEGKFSEVELPLYAVLRCSPRLGLSLQHRFWWPGRGHCVGAADAVRRVAARRDAQRVARKSSTRRVRSAAASASYDGRELSAK